MLDIQEYTTRVDQYQGNGNGNNGNGNGNGYSHLEGDWGMFYKVAKGLYSQGEARGIGKTFYMTSYSPCAR